MLSASPVPVLFLIVFFAQKKTLSISIHYQVHTRTCCTESSHSIHHKPRPPTPGTTFNIRQDPLPFCSSLFSHRMIEGPLEVTWSNSLLKLLHTGGGVEKINWKLHGLGLVGFGSDCWWIFCQTIVILLWIYKKNVKKS